MATQQLPHIFSAQEIVPRIKDILRRFEVVRDTILRNVTKSDATFETVMRPMADVENDTIGDIGVIWMLQYGAADLDTQREVLTARQLLIQAEASWHSCEEMYHLLQAVQDKNEPLDAESRLLLDKALLEYRLAGCGAIRQEEKEAFAQETLSLHNVRMQAQQNIAQESDGEWFTVEELDSLPENELHRFRDSSKSSQDGMIFIPFSNGGTNAVLLYAVNPETRKKMYIADDKKLVKNIPLMYQIIQKRQALAKWIGYPSHSHLRMETRLLDNPAQVKQFLTALTTGLIRRGRQELRSLHRQRKHHLNQQDTVMNSDENIDFPPWDLKFYQRLISSERMIDDAAVAEYFPLDITIQAMLGLFSSFLQLKFTTIPTNELDSSKIWHSSVQVFSVWDARQDEAEFVGYLYFDLLWREHKFRGGHNVTMECGYKKPNGQRHYPSTILMCAFPTSTDTDCVLLKHHELITVFHELGHAIHSLTAKTKFSRFHGTKLPPDFVELPSLMLENWCWMPQVLQSLSTHYSYLSPVQENQWQLKNPGVAKPPIQIPTDLVDALIKYRYSSRGLYHLRQLSVSLFDLHIHSLESTQDVQNLDLRDLWYNIRTEIEGFNFAECNTLGSEFVSFTHLISGYDMAYYSYLCCSSLAQDLFQTVFKETPDDKIIWERYRGGILEYGASHPNMSQLLHDILGRTPNQQALLNFLDDAIL